MSIFLMFSSSCCSTFLMLSLSRHLIGLPTIDGIASPCSINLICCVTHTCIMLLSNLIHTDRGIGLETVAEAFIIVFFMFKG